MPCRMIGAISIRLASPCFITFSSQYVEECKNTKQLKMKPSICPAFFPLDHSAVEWLFQLLHSNTGLMACF